MRILVGDVGGTKTRLALMESAAGALESIADVTLPSADYPNLESLIKESGLHEGANPLLASFGVAGPVRGNRCEVTNLPWSVDGAELAPILDVDQVTILNDLEAVGWGLDLLPSTSLLTLNQGHPEPQGNEGIIAPGTGLGEAFRVFDGNGWQVRGSEGSHGDFAPANDREYRLHAFLQEEYGHVSWERVASGPSLKVLFDFLVEQEGRSFSSDLRDAICHRDPSAAIAEAALSGEDETAAEALQWFLSLLGAEAGNHALKVMATGGVFIAGGVPLKILDAFSSGPFLERFYAKGQMEALMRRMPVHLVLEDRVALLGAAAYALAQEE